MGGSQWWPIYSGVRASCLPCPLCFIIEWCGIRLRGPKNWNSDLKGLRDDFRYYFHTLKTRWNQKKPWNNGSVLFVDNNYCYYISTVSFCLWLSMAKMERDCNSKKTGPTFSSYAPVLQKNDRKQITLCFVFDIVSLRVLSMSTDAWLRTPCQHFSSLWWKNVELTLNSPFKSDITSACNLRGLRTFSLNQQYNVELSR